MDEQTFLANLTRLMELKELEAQIEAEQREIRGEIAAYLEARSVKIWTGQLMGKGVKVTRQERVQIRYDEKLLRERLGDRYREIISLDRKLLASRESEVFQWLGEHALEVSKVDRQKVKEALERGGVDPEAFRGTFERQVSQTVALQVLDGGDSNGR
jgi:hypothetical protein